MAIFLLTTKAQRAEKVIKNVLELSLEGRADDDTVEPDLKRARLALRTLVNFCNRSTKYVHYTTTILFFQIQNFGY